MAVNPNRYTVQIIQVGTLAPLGTTHVDATSDQDAAAQVARRHPRHHGDFYNVHHRASGSMQRYTYDPVTDTATVY